MRRRPAFLLATDDERTVWAHVEDGDDGAAEQRVAEADLGNTVNRPAAHPHREDSAAARRVTELEFDLSAHRGVRILDATRVAGNPGHEEGGHERLQPALASIVAQGLAEHPRLKPLVELGDESCVAGGLSMDRVL